MIRWKSCGLLPAAVIGACMTAGCRGGDAPPQAPSIGGSTAPIRVTGTEKVAWDQIASNATQLAGYRYIAYIDDAPVDLAATCGPTTNDATFPCSAALPKLSPGPHRLQLAVEETGGKRQHSPKSRALILNVVPPNKSP
jgi:hypothetical protein